MYKLEFGQHWTIWNDHCAFVTAVYCVWKALCVCLNFSENQNSCHSCFKQFTHSTSEQDKNAGLHWNRFSPNLNLYYAKYIYRYFVGYVSFWFSTCSGTNLKRKKQMLMFNWKIKMRFSNLKKKSWHMGLQRWFSGCSFRGPEFKFPAPAWWLMTIYKWIWWALLECRYMCR